MAKYQNALPQMSGSLFVTDGGLETTLIFHEGIALPRFAAFVLMQDESGTRALERYFQDYRAMAQRYGGELIMESQPSARTGIEGESSASPRPN